MTKVTKTLVYNEKNLCIEEKMEGQKTLTTYDVHLPYLPKRIEKYTDNTLTSYLDLNYNSLGQLEKEDHSGSVTIWKYQDRGFPCEKIQETGTDDPHVVTTYVYNQQGQCIEVTSSDGVQKNVYDLMGNQTESKIFSSSGELISAVYVGYDLNNAPIWRQTANPENIVYFDYHASGRIKAKRQMLTPSRLIAYTLYAYNPCGYLIEEIDPRGYVTRRDYDLLGRVKAEEKEGHRTHFSYEAGGLIETNTSASGAQITRRYTTNGLLKEELYPDGTKNQIVYDLLGRPVLETKNTIMWEIKYDDAQHRVIRTHLKLKDSEISEFDLQGNLVRFTDAVGYTLEKTYDGLGRLKTETTPSGKQTLWNYQGNLTLCTLPNGETKTTHYAGGRVIKTEATNASGALVAYSTLRFDPENDTEEVVEGDKRTVTWLNALGLPVKTEQGNLVAQHEYDASGNCVSSIDGDQRITRQEFDGLGRLVQKRLPDGSILKFCYDLDSNLTEYHLPNGTIWKASYDLMRRKTSEELFSSENSSGCWTFSYEDGNLIRAIDPMQRTHTYLYDLNGRLFQDSVEGSTRTYTYEPRGYLATVEQMTENACEKTCVERSYDADGNLSLESTYLNAHLIQQTKQTWTANRRSLQIGNHARDCIYQNNQLVQVSTQHAGIAYSYDLSGALNSKNNALSSTLIDYNASGHPTSILTRLPTESYQEQLEWYPSGKLSNYTAPGVKQHFCYNERGYLQSTGSEKYEFDFGSIGIGVCTTAPGWYVPQDGLDDFGKILCSVVDKNLLSTEYNPIGEVITYGQRQLFWDPWGKLTKIIDPAFSWEASYDALGRRLQTRYTKAREQTCVTNSFYDPNEEFQEIGVQIQGNTFWKIYGPDASCDVISDETGASVTLTHNALRHLTSVVSCQGTICSEKLPSAYGPLKSPSSDFLDLTTYARSLTWHSKSQDPTEFIWMGDRYYDSRSGRFLSQDSVAYPSCLDLYAYADGDPINYFDPDGRFASPVYQPIKSTVLSVWNHPRFQGSLQAFGGIAEGVAGAALAPTPLAGLGFALLGHGADQFAAGSYAMMTGGHRATVSEILFHRAGMSPHQASLSNNLLSFGGFTGATGFARSFAHHSSSALSQAAMRSFEVSASSLEGLQAGKNFKPFTKSYYRENLKILTDINPPSSIDAHHVFPQKFRRNFIDAGINIDHPNHLTWVEGKAHLRAARKYNAEWRDFFDVYPEATESQILEKGKKLMNDVYGTPTNY